MTGRANFSIILTCEHGGNEVPAEYQSLFISEGAQRDLKSHRGYDPGALRIAECLAATLQVELHASRQSRLLIELNRSLGSSELFSKYTSSLDATAKKQIIATVYKPFRRGVVRSIDQRRREQRCVVHLSIHTFTPRYRGTVRQYDIGVLYDPSRPLESRLSRAMLQGFSSFGFEARANMPYLGTDDGHTTELRTRYEAAEYVGIEIEVNNRYAKFSERTKRVWSDKFAQVVTTLLD